MTNTGKMPALHSGIGLNAVRESGSAGVPPAKTNVGKMPALRRGIGLNAGSKSRSAGVPAAMTNAGKMPALCDRNRPGRLFCHAPYCVSTSSLRGRSLRLSRPKTFRKRSVVR